MTPHPSPTKLTIEKIGFLGNDFKEYASTLINLAHIQLINCEFITFFFHRWAEKDASGSFSAPNLTEIHLQQCKFRIRDLFVFIHNRMEVVMSGEVRKLERITVNWPALTEKERSVFATLQEKYPESSRFYNHKRSWELDTPEWVVRTIIPRLAIE